MKKLSVCLSPKLFEAETSPLPVPAAQDKIASLPDILDILKFCPGLPRVGGNFIK